MKKTVCIMTSEESFLNNYGAALQGYALSHTIDGMGYESKIVRYNGGMPPRSQDISLYRRFYCAGSRIYHRLLPTPAEHEARKLTKRYSVPIARREHQFKAFQAKNMRFYGENRVCWADLRECPPQADIFLCGSDQIWNPYFRGQHNDLGYFLDFAPKGKPRIAYAPSFGCEALPAPAKVDFVDLIQKFSAVSVREQAGRDIIAREAGVDAPVVADPTLLLTSNEWEAIESPVDGLPEKYILCYRFSDNDETRTQINSIAEQTDLPVFSLPLSIPSLRDKDEKIFNAGPAEFVWLIHHATLVCTDSFHATVFSLIFNIPFYVFLREDFSGEKANMNSRIMNLLDMSQLRERLITANRVPKKSDIYSIDFQKFQHKAEALRANSKNWLKKALDGDAEQ